MKRDKLNRKLAEFDRLFKNYYEESFELQKTEVLRIEQEIRNIVGNDPDYLNCEVLRDRKEDLVFLLDSRRTLLNWMYQETDEEVARMEIVNSRLFDLTKRLRVKMADVCESVASSARDDFDDDFNVEGTLRFCYNGEESLLSYPDADVYGSDYRLMIVTNNWLTGDDPLHYLEMSCRFNASRESILQTDDLDDDLSWEKNKSWNLGIDFRFLKHFSGSIDVYSRKTTDMLLDKAQSSTSGFNTALTNVGSMRNTGIEFQFDAEIINTKDWKWNFGFNIAHNKSKILELAGDEMMGTGAARYIVGEKLLTYYLKDYYGVNPVNGEALWRTEDGSLSNDNSKARYVKCGSPEPTFIGGLNTTLSWKNLSLSIVGEFKKSFELLEETR